MGHYVVFRCLRLLEGDDYLLVLATKREDGSVMLKMVFTSYLVVAHHVVLIGFGRLARGNSVLALQHYMDMDVDGVGSVGDPHCSIPVVLSCWVA